MARAGSKANGTMNVRRHTLKFILEQPRNTDRVCRQNSHLLNTMQTVNLLFYLVLLASKKIDKNIGVNLPRGVVLFKSRRGYSHVKTVRVCAAV